MVKSLSKSYNSLFYSNNTSSNTSLTKIITSSDSFEWYWTEPKDNLTIDSKTNLIYDQTSLDKKKSIPIEVINSTIRQFQSKNEVRTSNKSRKSKRLQIKYEKKNKLNKKKIVTLTKKNLNKISLQLLKSKSSSELKSKDKSDKFVTINIRKEKSTDPLEDNHRDKPKEIKKQYWRKSKWEGNSDDEGSVDSALLDENICYNCGLNTLQDKDWNQLILCDVCDGEYHLRCLNLCLPPRTIFKCPKCIVEAKEFEGLKYIVKGEKFKIPIRKRSKQSLSICYSPSRPIDIAWNECREKGFMVVSQVLSYDVMKKLTHGEIIKYTNSGRRAEIWTGVVQEMSTRIHNSCCNLVLRGGRFDLRLPEFVVDSLELDRLLQPITNKLITVMGTPTPIIRTHNIVFAPIGSPAQNWHYDDCITKAKFERYFTILIPLNTIDSNAGGTEIWSRKQRRADLVRPRPGDAFVFSGGLCHRGQANNGFTHRFFYYASFACKADANTVELS